MADPTLKVVVAYHKNSTDRRAKLREIDPYNEVYVPVMGGHALGNIPETFADMQGDDTGEDNWSSLNPYLCELTCAYWAWKNMDILGNPDHIGLCHYARVIVPYSWLEYGLLPRTICAMQHAQQGLTNDAFIASYTPSFKAEADRVLNAVFPDQESQAFLTRFREFPHFPHYNIFVMETEEFDRFMQFNVQAFNMLQDVLEGSRTTGAYPTRALACILEYLNGFYILHAANIRGYRFQNSFIVH